MFRIDVSWLAPPSEADAVGPERATWSEIRLQLGEWVLTRNHPADYRTHAQPRDVVIGGASGIAEWFVENWLSVAFELHTPFQKGSALGQSSPPDRPAAPGLRDAWNGWQLFGDLDVVAMSQWQHRHTVGEGTTDLALPSIVLLANDEAIGVVLDHPPTMQLEPTVRFDPPTDGIQYPQGPVWVARGTVERAVDEFLNATIDRASASEDTAAVRWATWLRERWRRCRQDTTDPAVRRRYRLGTLVADWWTTVEETRPTLADILDGILSDAETVSAIAQVEQMLKVLEEPQKTPKLAVDLRAIQNTVSQLSPPYLQGYLLAERLRDALGVPDEPISELGEVLRRVGIDVRADGVGALFRSAVVARDQRACIYYTTEGHTFTGTAPTRFAISAALGRLVAEYSNGSLGAAHGSQARWIQTQRANAFAAEFLAPRKAMRHMSDPGEVQDRCGISGAAARWHWQNRGPGVD